MSWSLLPTNYTDAVWSGLKKYTEINNSDGTVSFNDVTTYTNKENSFFGAKDANSMNEALNYIMSMLENGTDLYEEFKTYFTTQKELFEEKGDTSYEEIYNYFNTLKGNSDTSYQDFVTYLTNLKTKGDTSLKEIEDNYESQMTSYENAQVLAFTTWFDSIKGKLADDIATSLQAQITDVEERLTLLEHMVLTNSYTVPLAVNDSDTTTLLVDDDGYAILAEWKE